MILLGVRPDSCGCTRRSGRHVYVEGLCEPRHDPKRAHLSLVWTSSAGANERTSA